VGEGGEKTWGINYFEHILPSSKKYNWGRRLYTKAKFGATLQDIKKPSSEQRRYRGETKDV